MSKEIQFSSIKYTRGKLRELGINPNIIAENKKLKKEVKQKNKVIWKLKDKLKQDIHKRCEQNYPGSSLAFSKMKVLNERDQEILDYLKELEG